VSCTTLPLAVGQVVWVHDAGALLRAPRVRLQRKLFFFPGKKKPRWAVGLDMTTAPGGVFSWCGPLGNLTKASTQARALSSLIVGSELLTLAPGAS